MTRSLAIIVTTLGLLVLATAAPAAMARENVSIVAVDLADSTERQRLLGLGVDVMYLQERSAEVLAYGEQDVAVLRRAGFAPQVLVADVESENLEARQAEERKAELLEDSPSLGSGLPTGRVSYRTMDETNAELRELARRYPQHVSLFELPHRTLLGQRVLGIHISRDGTTDSGRPIFLNTGVNHAREWPTVEFTMEFAWDVLQNFGSDTRTTRLLDRADMIVVPMVGPDAYDISRRLVHEMKRKNCRMVPGEIPTREQCEAPQNEFLGVDLNRNYAAFWGGPGSNSTNETNMYYQGTGPFSEPETQNMRDLLASHHVTVAFNNHTPDRRLLRVPSAVNEPVPADEQMYDELAQRIGAVLNWPATPWTIGYSPASGTAEQSWYYAAGTFAFTPEATPGPHPGLFRYHPPYEYVIDQYFGTANAPGCVPGRTCYDGSSMREAFLLAFEAAGDPARHSVITGTVKPGGAKLTIEKVISLHTSPVPSPPERMVDLTLRSTMTVPKSGRYTWHVNPSRRPSQLETAHLPESWTLSCQRGAPGSSAKPVEVQITVGRGETAHANLRGCSRR
jgi:carboxypeptidase T